jgi:group II intron reverse transcriptase/maturase
MSPGLTRVRERARKDSKTRFTSLLHHITEEVLESSFYRLKRNSAPGLDNVIWRDYREDLRSNIVSLHERVHSGSYRATPVKRVYIPKEDGSSRPLGIAILEDKIVQQALVKVLNQIYEEDFLGFSYGFRPERSPHNALDELYVAITCRKVNWLLDADISGFFDEINHEYLTMFIEHRIADRRVIRLIKKWLKTGYVEKGKQVSQKMGTPQGAVISPLLANIFLHYALDLWVNKWQKTQAKGEVYIVRYADDFVVCFQYQSDAKRFEKELNERLKKFGLNLHPGKTRLIEFGRFAKEDRKKRSQGKPETFDFLGFTHICSKNKNGRFMLRRKTVNKRLTKKIREVKKVLKERRHDNVKEVGMWLRSVITGFINYYAVPTNMDAVRSFKDSVVRAWLKTLRRRSQKGRKLRWEKFRKYVDWLIPSVRIVHPFPTVRFAVKT